MELLISSRYLSQPFNIYSYYMTTILYPAEQTKIKDTSNNSIILSSNKIELSKAGATASTLQQDASGSIMLSSVLNMNSNNIYVGDLTSLPLAGQIGAYLPHTALSANATVFASTNSQMGYITLPSGVWVISATMGFNWTTGSQLFIQGSLTQGSVFSSSTVIATVGLPQLATPVSASSSGFFNLNSIVSTVAGDTVWLGGKSNNVSGGTCHLFNTGANTFMKAVRIA